MDARQLEVFEAVARLGGFTRAAVELHLVQSAVSATIASLETDLGHKLFDRSTRRVTLTPAGRALTPHATTVLASLRAARDAVEAVAGGLSGTIRIGYMTNVTLFDIPALLGRFTALHPEVSVHMSPAATGTAGLAAALRAGDLDIAFLSATPGDLPDLRVTELASSPLGLAVPIGHPLSERTGITLAETTGLRFVDFREGFANRTVVDREFRARGLQRDVRIETSDTNDTAALVRNGLGVAFLPEFLVEGDDSIRLIPLTDATFTMLVSVATSPDHTITAAVERLAEMAARPQARRGTAHEGIALEGPTHEGPTHEGPAVETASPS